jgi:uncharacterized protein YkwD
MKIFIRIFFAIFIVLLISYIFIREFSSKNIKVIQYTPLTTFSPISTPVLSPIPTIKKITPRPTRIPTTPIPTDSTPWGVATQTGEHTWTMKIGQDPVMATPEEILSALNAYRQRYGSQVLISDPKLTAYAQSRVDYFNQIQNIDSHVGFNNFLEKEDGFNKLGFTYVGENISIGYRLNGVHIIEWIYAGDEPHNKNQLASKWDHVGIAVKGTATCLIFATGKM